MAIITIYVMPIARTYIAYRAARVLCAIMIVFSCADRDRVEELGIFSPDRLKSIAGQDGCTPIEYTGGMLWTFGDTILGTWTREISVNSTFEKDARMEGMLSNSCAMTEKATSENVNSLHFIFHRKNGRVAQCIPHLPGEDPARVRLWPVDGIVYGGTIYVYYMKIGVIQNSALAMPFVFMGMGLAEYAPPGGIPGADSMEFRRTAMLFGPGEPTFGDSVILRDGYLYCIGHGNDRQGAQAAYVCRVRPDDIAMRGKYEFIGKDGMWHARFNPADGFFMDIMGELSLSYHDAIHRYVIVYASRDGSIKTCSFRVFGELGRASSKTVYRPPSLPVIKSRPIMFYYSAKEIFKDTQSIYAIYINPAVYQPILIRIPLHLVSAE